MEPKKRLAGRFLPSRVFARWIWIVRFGLSVVPLILFLAGSLVLYFAPSRYQSSAVFEYLGKRPLPEVEALLKSRNIFDIAADRLELSKRLGVSKGTAFDLVSPQLETSLDAASGWIKLEATYSKSDLARDIAAELTKALESYESSLATRATETRINALETAVTDARDESDAKQQFLTRLISVRGYAPVDPIASLDVDAARHDWQNARARVLDAEAVLAEARLELANPGRWVEIHSVPQISDKAVGRDSDDSLGSVTLKALGAGLAFALLTPYLLELAFPRRLRGKAASGEWHEMEPVREISGMPVNG